MIRVVVGSQIFTLIGSACPGEAKRRDFSTEIGMWQRAKKMHRSWEANAVDRYDWLIVWASSANVQVETGNGMPPIVGVDEERES